MRELEPVGGQWQGAQERRGERQRVHRRAWVVHEAGQRELLGATTAADRGLALQQSDRAACLGQRYGTRQPVGAGADYRRARGRGLARAGAMLSVRQPRDRGSAGA